MGKKEIQYGVDTDGDELEPSADDLLRDQATTEAIQKLLRTAIALRENNFRLESENDLIRKENQAMKDCIAHSLKQNRHLKLNSEYFGGEVDHTPGSQKEDDIDTLKQLETKNQRLKQENKELIEQNQEIYSAHRQLLEDSENHQAPCGCDRRSFVGKKVKPYTDKAVEEFAGARQKTLDKNAKIAENIVEIRKIVYRMLTNAVRPIGKGRSRRKARNTANKKIQDKVLAERADEITGELIENGEIGIHQVEKILNDVLLFPTKRVDVVAANRSLFNKLVNKLGAKSSLDPYFDILRTAVKDAAALGLPGIWREMLPEQEANASLEQAAHKANWYCGEFFEDDSLDEEVMQTDNLSDLQNIVRECINKRESLPVTPKNFKKLISAATKIRMMHLAETIRLTVNFDETKSLTCHVQEIIQAYTAYTPDAMPVLTVDTPLEDTEYYEKNDQNDPSSIVVNSIRFRGKEEMSVAQKTTVKDIGDKESDPGKIYDYAGLKIELSARDSREENIKKATIKILSILFAIFGTDYPKSRLRYTFETGMSNGYSTGEHKAFHITIRLRNQCVSNGIDEDGKPRDNEKYLEVQIVVNMDKEAEEKDHAQYKRKQIRRIQNITGMDRSFEVWLTDLAEIALSKKEFISTALSETNYFKYTDKEIIAHILFEALTLRDKKGDLVNLAIIKRILTDQKQRKKFEKVADKYREKPPDEKHKEYQPVSRQNRERAGMSISERPITLHKLATEALKVINRIGPRTPKTPNPRKRRTSSIIPAV